MFVTYPDVANLSGCCLPIRMCLGGRGLQPGRRPPHWWRVVGAERLRPPARRSRRELCSARRLEARPALWPLVCPLAGLIWIGYAHADRLLSYPDARYLSRCCLPIRMRVGGRRPGPLHSRGSAFMFVGQRCDTTEVGITPVRRWRHAPTLASCSLTGVMLPHWCHALASSCVGSGDGSPTMSHVIPPRLPQTLTLHRWNCNVLSSARKMTEGNYVRLLFGEVR